MKHLWNAEQTLIIQALKDELPRNSTRSTEYSLFHEGMYFLQTIEKRCRRSTGLPHLWQELRRYDLVPEKRSYLGNMPKDAPLFLYIFCQGAAAVFWGDDVLHKKNHERTQELFKVFFCPRKPFTLPHLPERLQDPGLIRAVKEKDGAKVIFLYNTAATHGAKLRNIFNALINAQAYDTAMEVHSQTGGLEEIPTEILLLHRLLVNEEEFPAFVQYVSTLSIPESSRVWEEYMASCEFPLILPNGLDMGISPDLPLWRSSKGDTVSLRLWAYLVDELHDELMGCISENAAQTFAYDPYVKGKVR